MAGSLATYPSYLRALWEYTAREYSIVGDSVRVGILLTYPIGRQFRSLAPRKPIILATWETQVFSPTPNITTELSAIQKTPHRPYLRPRHFKKPHRALRVELGLAIDR